MSSVEEDSVRIAFQRQPKIELHLHLEGAIPLPCLWHLIQKYGGDPEVPTLDALVAKFRYRDFDGFIDTWVWKNQFVREYEDFTYIAREVARDLVVQKIIYSEVFYSPGDYGRVGLKPQEITGAIRQGLREVPEIEIALITDLIRDHGPERGMRTLELMNEVRKELGVVGVGLGGSEHIAPPEPYAAVYERARSLGFRTTAHAGEVCGPESIWGAIRALRVDRIGHATRAIEDPALVDYLAEHRIPVEVCLTSNVLTGVVPSLARHPVRTYFERGIPLSVNTDDPKLFHTSLAEEYARLETELGFSRAEIVSLIEQAVHSSWLSDERKLQMVERMRAEGGQGDPVPEDPSPGEKSRE
jgi:adenosine deaminase